MNKTIKQITNILLQSHGVDVSKYDEAFLNKSFQKRILETRCGTEQEYLNFIEKNNNEAAILINSLHNNYSEFFRNSLTFSVLERIILPMLIQQKKECKSKEIRIWSAACAGGQESYSIAMLFEEQKNSYNDSVKYRIFATDQCELQVKKAGEGQFSAHLINNLNLKRIKEWTEIQGHTYTIKKKLKKKHRFFGFRFI